jgi:ferredoxin
VYYIVPGKCTECVFNDEPQCAAVCPVDCCIPDDNHVEDEETLFKQTNQFCNERFKKNPEFIQLRIFFTNIE